MASTTSCGTRRTTAIAANGTAGTCITSKGLASAAGHAEVGAISGCHAGQEADRRRRFRASVEFGNELMSGSGTTWVSEFRRGRDGRAEIGAPRSFSRMASRPKSCSAGQVVVGAAVQREIVDTRWALSGMRCCPCFGGYSIGVRPAAVDAPPRQPEVAGLNHVDGTAASSASDRVAFFRGVAQDGTTMVGTGHASGSGMVHSTQRLCALATHRNCRPAPLLALGCAGQSMGDTPTRNIAPPGITPIIEPTGTDPTRTDPTGTDPTETTARGGEVSIEAEGGAG